MKKELKIFLLLLILLSALSLFFYIKKNLNKKTVTSKLKPTPTILANISEKLTIEKIFKKLPKNNFSFKPSNKKIHLLVTGDIIPARSVNYIMTKNNDFNLPFKKTSFVLNKADLLLINLEAPLIDNCPISTDGMTFCGDIRFIQVLKNLNKNLVVNTANNHFENYGSDKAHQTIQLLEQNKILTFGNKKSAMIKIKNKTFGFLGFNFIVGGQILEESTISSLISNLRKKVDFLIIMYHWGDEYTSFPNDQQKKLAQLAINLGADLVLGNHPHWIQAMAFYKNRPIIYSHGNFVFDQMWSEKTRQGIIGHYVFGQKEIEEIFFYPVVIENYHQPRLANENEAKKILNEMYNNSKKLAEEK